MGKTQQNLNSIANNRSRVALNSILGTNWAESAKTLFESPTESGMGTATGAGLSPALWSDCPRGLMVFDPTLGHFVGDDFTLSNGESYATAKDYTLAGANGTLTHLAGDPNGVLLCTGPAAADNNESNVNLNSGVGVVSLTATATWWYETRIKINQITTGQGAFVGLVGDQITVGVDFMTDTSMALKVNPIIGFQVLSPDATKNPNWQSTYNKTGGTQAVVNATAASQSTGWIKLGLKCTTNGTVGTVRFFVDGVADSTSVLTSATNFPINLYAVPVWAIKCGTAAINILSVDWWYAAQLR